MAIAMDRLEPSYIHARHNLRSIKSGPPQPRKSSKNGFTRNVTDVLRGSSFEAQAMNLPKRQLFPRKATANSSPPSSPRLTSHTIRSDQDGEKILSPKWDQKAKSQPLLDADVPSFSPSFPEGSDKQVWGEDEFDLQSLEHKAVEELYKRPKRGESYEAVDVDVERIEKRLKHLSIMNVETMQNPNTMIDEGLEIADSVSLLKIKGTSSSKIVDMAGQKAQRAATLILEAQILFKKASVLLSQSKDILQTADF